MPKPQHHIWCVGQSASLAAATTGAYCLEGVLLYAHPAEPDILELGWSASSSTYTVSGHANGGAVIVELRGR